MRNVSNRTTLPEFIQLPSMTNDTMISYRLKAIVVHHGLSMNSGHYYAFVLFHSNDFIEKTTNNHLGWWLFNDTHVEHLTFDNVCAHFQRFQSATPYVLVFEKENQGKSFDWFIEDSQQRQNECLDTENDSTPMTILPALQTLVDRDNQLYLQVNLTNL